MIKIRQDETEACPVFVCDICSREIKEGQGNAIWTPTDIGEYSDVKHVHRLCDPKDGYWVPLAHHAFYLGNNSGVTKEVAKDATYWAGV